MVDLVDLAKVYRKVYGWSTIAAPLPIVHENYRIGAEAAGPRPGRSVGRGFWGSLRALLE